MARAWAWAAIVPRCVAEDDAARSRMLARLGERLPDLVDAAASPRNTVLVWSVLRLRGPDGDELEAEWAPGRAWPEWAEHARLEIRRR